MKLATSIPLLGAACGLALLCPGLAQAQFGAFPMNLPQSDFTWTWGNRNRAEAARAPDFSLSGSDRGFVCDLSGRMRVGSQWTRADVRNLENEVRTNLSFIEASTYYMNLLDRNREIDWARLECERTGQGPGSGGEATGTQNVTGWIELEVMLHEDFPAPAGQDGGHWTVSYTQAQNWRLRASRTDGRGTYTVRSEGLLLPSVLSDIDGSAYAVCFDGSGDSWRTEWQGPVEPDPISLSATNEGGQLVLWASVPELRMQHPGHGHIPSGSECRTVDDPHRDRFTLHHDALERAGAQVDARGAFRVATLEWDEAAAAATGRGPALSFTMSHEGAADGGQRVAFEIRGTIRSPDEDD